MATSVAYQLDSIASLIRVLLTDFTQWNTRDFDCTYKPLAMIYPVCHTGNGSH